MVERAAALAVIIDVLNLLTGRLHRVHLLHDGFQERPLHLDADDLQGRGCAINLFLIHRHHIILPK